MSNSGRRPLEEIIPRWRFEPDSAAVASGLPKTFWRRLYSLWMKFARILARVNTTILLTLVYFLIIGPIAIVLKAFGKDLLDRKAERRSSYWYDKGQEKPTLERSYQQF